jgi:hypothetical protein
MGASLPSSSVTKVPRMGHLGSLPAAILHLLTQAKHPHSAPLPRAVEGV